MRSDHGSVANRLEGRMSNFFAGLEAYVENIKLYYQPKQPNIKTWSLDISI
jgi:hypothetical protein